MKDIGIVMTKSFKLPPLDERLFTAASLVRDGAVIADIGTDHGYIPISLLLEGKIQAAAASDIRPGPLNRAISNGEKYGVSEKMHFFLTDGLQNIPLADLGVTDIIVCGMGGELISEILSACPYIRNENIRLILQPMSAVESLRKYLADSSFAITDERLACSNRKLYQCIAAQYDGMTHAYTLAQLLLGKQIIKQGAKDPLFTPLLQKYIQKTQREYQGKLQGGSDDAEQTYTLLKELLQIAKEKGIDCDACTKI